MGRRDGGRDFHGRQAAKAEALAGHAEKTALGALLLRAKARPPRPEVAPAASSFDPPPALLLSTCTLAVPPGPLHTPAAAAAVVFCGGRPLLWRRSLPCSHGYAD